ncbi:MULTISPECIES: hypothetical protein [Staphylococcus]|uniref:hypothetical protein n=1 Tax=Staphylococcus TaxID=1279 RepID=UPI0008FAF04E|nr:MULTISPECIES: hypothetical protein [Staphylococcus]MDV3052484.1 hypothetical protein [Staphylococcus ureilyticus]OIS31402.1 hypothetical protein RES9_01920 [Staphylococcus cohnii]OIS32316.1 hypothetical protein RES10_04590 [Staphylococcus cohnii]OIS33061.1 hypothetical protein RES8_05260 [Staphylococcus cohnii]
MASKTIQKPTVKEIFPIHLAVIKDMLEQSKHINNNASYQESINDLYNKLEEGNLSTQEYELTLNEIDDLRREKATNPNVNGQIVINLPSNIKSLDQLQKVTHSETDNANKVIKSVEKENESINQQINELKAKIESNNNYIGEILNQQSLNDVAKPIIEGESKYYDAKKFYSDFMWQKATGLLQNKTFGKKVVKYPNLVSSKI